MGQLHNELRDGVLSGALTKAVGDSRPEGGLERYGETLTPTINLWERAEWSFLRNEALCGDGVGIAAGGATFLGTYALVNPANSGFLVIALAANVSIDAAAIVQAGMGTEAAVAALAQRLGTFLDTRRVAGTNPRAFIRQGTNAGSLGSVFESANPGPDLNYRYGNFPVVISPGFAVILQNQDDNAGARFWIRWYERVAKRGEL